MNRWNELNSGELEPPAILQHDVIGTEHLIWVWTGEKIIGPLSRNKYDEAAIFADIETIMQEEQNLPIGAE
jgi:hypothetical protein